MVKAFSLRMLLVAFVFSYFSLNAQENESLVNFIPKTPEASLLDTYGAIEANNSTGVPDISIPLHTIKVDGITLPITLSYITSGVRVNDIATPVGLKWLLNCGGMVSRNVIGKYDEFGWGGWLHIDTTYFEEAMINTCEWEYNKPLYEGNYENGGNDYAPDRFSYSTTSSNGNFVFRNNGEIEQTIKSGDKIIPNNDFNPYNSFFTIYDTQGNVFLYDQPEKNKIINKRSVSGFSTQDWGKAAVGWKPSKITTSLGHEINFSYLEYEYNTDFYKTDVELVLNHDNMYADPYTIYGMFVSETQIFTESKLIDSISTDNEIILFNYTDDPDLSVMKKKLIEIIVKERYTEALLKTITFHYDMYSGDPRLKLVGISISDETNPVQNFTFSYNGDNETGVLPEMGAPCQDVFGYINTNSVEWMIPNVPPSVGYPSSDREVNPTTITKGTLKKITYPTGGSTQFFYEPNFFVTEANDVIYYPGLRAQSIKNLDLNQKIVSEKFYEYGMPMSNQSHTYGNFGDHVYRTINMDPERRYPFIKYSSNPVSPFYFFPGSGFGYERVKSFQVRNGYTEEFFTYVDDCFNLKMLPLKTYIANEQGDTIKEVLRNYTITDISTVKNYTLGETYEWIRWYDCAGDEGPICSGLPDVCALGFKTYYGPIIDLPLISVKMVELNTETSKEFFENGEEITSKTHYSYNSYSQVSVKVQQQLTSDSQVVEESKQNILYPTDYSNQGIPSLDSMIVKNMVGIPVEVTAYKKIDNEMLMVSGDYSVFNSLGQVTEQQKWRSSTPGTGTWENVAIYTYDSSSKRIVEAKIMDNTSSYIWGYSQRFPVAKATNASQQDIAYTGFETSENYGGWNYNGSLAYLDASNSKTGEYSYKIYNGGNITKLLQANTEYEVSYWVKDGALIVSGGFITDISQSQPDANGWVLYKKTVSVSTSPVTLTISWANGPNARVDDVRIHPSSAQMETYTWLPGRGVTSVTDANGTTSFYEYDSLGRLTRITDFEGNTLKEFEYHYVNSIEE